MNLSSHKAISEMVKYLLLLLFVLLNPSHVNVPFLYPMITPENRRFYNVFRGYRNRKLASKGLTRRESWYGQGADTSLFSVPI